MSWRRMPSLPGRLLFLAVICLGQAVIAQDSEPAIRNWVAQLKDKDAWKRLQAIEALGNVGNAAVPILLDALKDPSPAVRLGAAQALGKIADLSFRAAVAPALMKAMKDGDRLVRWANVEWLQQIIAKPQTKEPALADDMKGANAGVGSPTAAPLEETWVLKVAVPALKTALTDPNAEVRSAAATALEKTRRNVGAVVLTLVKVLQDPDPDVRVQAAVVLGKIGEEAKDATPAVVVTLVKVLKDRDPDVRVQAAVVLGKLGEEAKDAIPAVFAALKDQDARVRREAAAVLKQIDPINSLVAELKDPNPEVSSDAEKALGKMGEDAVPALIEILKDGSQGVRLSAAWVLGRQGARAKAAVPGLIDLLRKDPNDDVRWGAGLALEKIGAAAVPGLIEVLKDEDPRVRLDALGVLGAMGGAAKAAVPALIEAMNVKGDGVAAMTPVLGIAEALGRIGPGAVPALVECLKDGNPNRRLGAAAALAMSKGVEAKSGISVLITALQDMDENVRENAAMTLGSLGVRAKAAVPALSAALDDYDENVRHSAERALQAIDPEATP